MVRTTACLWMLVLLAGACTEKAPAGGEPAKTTEPAKPSSAPLSCASEIELLCPEGEMDACVTVKGVQLATHHVCVKEDTVPGLPCENEIALRCVTDFADACFQKPRVAKTHFCVRIKHDPSAVGN